jgi:hypothetical protein
MTDTPTSLSAELRRLAATKAEADATLRAAVHAALTTHDEACTAHAADLNRLAARIEAPPVAAPVWTPRFPGDTPPGSLRWGCSYESNTVSTAHETAAKVPVGVRRTFWRIDQATRLVDTCRADLAAGRVPWVSVKLGRLATWADTAAGKIDGHLLDLFKRLAALPGPVWFTVHHEPEGGGGTNLPDEGAGSQVHWRAMQARVRALLDTSGATNIAFAPILMAWTFSSTSGRNPADWWVPGVWDFAGIDNYVEAAAVTVRTAGWNRAVEFYRERGLCVAVGEWGNKDHGASGAREMRDWYDHLLDIGSPGACYFDTSLNGGVPLSGDVLVEFRRLMADPRSATLERA